MKKNYFKKSLSLVLTVLMLMSCWVFVAPIETDAASTDTTYRLDADQYGTPYWSANDTNTRWMLWGASRDVNDAHVWIRVPKTIYLDKGETLQSAGYKIEVEWSWGNGTSYRWGLGPAAWGNGNGINGQSGSQQFTMNTMFEGYSSDSSMNGSNEYGISGYDNANQYDLRVNDTYSGSTGFIVYKNTGGTSNRTNYIYLIGVPKIVGSGRYSTAGINPSPFNFAQQWKYVFPANKWTDDNTFHPTAKGKPTSVSEQLDGYNEVWWDVEIYDKASLKTAIDDANTIYNNNISYSTYVLDNGLSKLAQLTNEGGTMLSIREQTYQTVKDKTDVINNAAKSLQFQAKNTALINKVAEAEALQAKAGYNTLYTEASKQALQTAIDTAKSNKLYSAATIYSTANYPTDAGERAAGEQTTINNLISGIDTAINGLVRKYDIGYDNLFSFTDWALNPVKTKLSNSTLEIDADKGTIKFVHDGSTSGTDNNTNQGTDTNWYKAKVEGDTEYVLTWKTEGSGRGQIHVFYTTGTQWTYAVNSNYNSGSHWFVDSGDLPYSENMGSHTATFKTLPETDGLVFRFGTCNSGDDVTFSDIRLVKKSDYDAYAKNYTTIREVFAVGDTKNLSFTPTREGYVFDGWYKADGTTKVTSVSGFSSSDIVYAHWIQQHTVTFKNYDGTVLKTQKVAPGAAATAPTSDPYKAPDDNWEYQFAGWDTEFSNVTSDLVVTAEFTEKEHGDIRYTVKKSGDCETPGTITKTCHDCNYKWHNGEAFEDTEGEYAPALGHNYATIVINSSTGVDGVHTLECNNPGCTYGKNGGPATITEGHNFLSDTTKDTTATCTTPGTTYFKCACLQEKTVVGQLDANNHVNTEIRDIIAAECEKPGYTGDKWCIDCNTMIEKGSATDGLEHVYTNYVYNEGTATCFDNGTETATCDLCKTETNTREAANTKLTHTYTNYVYNNDAKCEVNGTETATCDYGCGTENTREAANTALKHDYTGTAKNNGDGTHSFLCKNNCGKYGATVECSSWKENATAGKCECTVCGYNKDHAWGDWSQDAGNTGDAAGKHTRTCKDCGAVDTPNCVYTGVKTPANCDDDAYTTYTCTTCGHGYTVIDKNTATGHNFNGAYTYDAENDKHQQACTNKDCTAKGVGTEKDAWTDCVWSYANAGEGKHTASCVCGNSEEQNCSGGTATCTTKAECQYCNTAYGETAGHVLTGTEKYIKKATNATCIANETYYKYCIGCENVFSDTETYEKPDTMTAHDYTCTDEYLYIATQAKCGVNETYYAYCSNPDCKKSSEDANNTYEKAGTALKHSWVNPVDNKDGTHTLSCENTNTDGWACEETLKLNCADSAIAFGYEPATCTEQGYTTYQCTACGYTWHADYEQALGHDYTQKIYDDAHLKAAANCEHENIYWYDCSRCDRSAEEATEGEVYTGQLTFLNGEIRKHNWVNVVDAKYLANAATCLAAAKYYASCSYGDCAKSAKDVEGETTLRIFSSGTALGHDWVKPADDKLADYLATAADCVTDATYYYVCSRADECGVVSSEEVTGATWTLEDSKEGHDLKYTAAKAATCDEAGNYEYWYCATCKKYFKDENATEAYLGITETVIKKREHDTEKVPFKSATCEKDGHPAYEYCKYDDCDYTTLPAVIPDGYKAKGHNFTGAYYCDTVSNYHAKFCANENCDLVTLTDAEGNPYQVKTFGMVVDGVQVKYNVEYDGLDYVITGGEACDINNYTAETVDGVHTHANVCICGNGSTKAYSDAETFVETVAPTCTADGYDSHKCPDANCGATWKKNIVATEGHKYSDAFTSNGDGTHSQVCSVCGAKKNTAKCSGGTATCKDQAVCDICKTAYGETGAHVLDENAWSEPYGATCTVDGKKKQTCSACNTEVEVIAEGSALGHEMSDYGYDISGWTNKPADFDASIVYEPTCKDEGVSISYCSRCDHYVTMKQKADKSKHVWATDENGEIIWELVSGNCSTGYTYASKCSVCGAVQSKVEEGKHEWKVISITRDVCEQYDFIVFECTKCTKQAIFDETYSEDGSFEGITDENGELINFVEKYDLKKGEHSWSEFKVTKEATCSTTGRQEKTCGKCGEKIKEDIPVIANAHNRDFYLTEGNNLKKVAAIEANCQRAGNHEYYECTRCSYSENAGNAYTINKLPHEDKDGDGICDNGCRDSMEEINAKKDGCICHKTNGFMKFIYSILRFFWKLFKINPVCSCGKAHY